MWTKVGVGLYCVAALWLAAFVAYLVYLLLPFGVGLLSSSFAALVAVLLLTSLIRRLIVGPLKGEPIGRWRSILVSAFALATLALDAGWTHYLVPFPPTNQDDCTFGPIGPEEYRALVREMSARFDPNWMALYGDPDAEEKLERQMTALLPKEATEADMVAHIHALARSLGAEHTGGEYYHQTPSYHDFRFAASYSYRFDLNTLLGLRRVIFQWARVSFRVAKSDLNSERTHLQYVAVVMPSIKQSNLLQDEAESSCPRPARPGPTLSEQNTSLEP